MPAYVRTSIAEAEIQTISQASCRANARGHRLDALDAHQHAGGTPVLNGRWRAHDCYDFTLYESWCGDCLVSVFFVIYSNGDVEHGGLALACGGRDYCTCCTCRMERGEITDRRRRDGVRRSLGEATSVRQAGRTQGR